MRTVTVTQVCCLLMHLNLSTDTYPIIHDTVDSYKT